MVEFTEFPITGEELDVNAVLDAATDASQSATDAALSRDIAAMYGCAHVDLFSDLSGVTADLLVVNDFVKVVSTGRVYRRAADAATDADLDYTGSGGLKLYEDGTDFTTREIAVAWNSRRIAASEALPDGLEVTAGGLKYVVETGATGISDLLGLKPLGVVSPAHYGYQTGIECSALLGAMFAGGGTEFEFDLNETYLVATAVTVPSTAHIVSGWPTFKETGGSLATPSFVRSMDVYEIGAADTIRIPAGHHDIQNIRFKITENRSTSGDPAILIEDGARINGLTVEVDQADAPNVRNVVKIMEDVRIRELNCRADAQIDNAATFDISFVNVVGADCYIGTADFTAIDKCMSVGGAYSATVKGGGADRFRCDYINAEGYQKVLQLKGLQGAQIGSINAHTRSEFASVNPGRNILHIDDSWDTHVNSIIGRNTTEHGIYISGGNGDNDVGLYGSRRNSFGTILLKDCWECGLKAKSDIDAGDGGVNVAEDTLQIGSISVMGAATNPAYAAWTSADGLGNADGLRIENIGGVNIGTVNVLGKEAIDRSSLVGIHLDGVARFNIGSAFIQNSVLAGIYMRTYRGDNNHGVIQNAHILDALGNALQIATTTAGDSYRNMDINLTGRHIAGDLVKITGDASAEVPSSARCFIDAKYEDVTGALINRTNADPDWRVRLTDMITEFT